MRGFIANTDYDWFTFLRAMQPPADEVNFWRPGSETSFKALDPGEPFFFRLKSPRNVISGYAHFSCFSKQLPTRTAWEYYGERNGAATYQQFRSKLLSLRASREEPSEFTISCILLIGAVFFRDGDWVQLPSDYAPSIQQGKSYDLTSGEGKRIWMECLGKSSSPHEEFAVSDLPLPGGYGEPRLVRPRLGQRSFRVAILDSYDRRCAITNERALPALEAAHIREFSNNPEHSIPNGILLRADIHNLFDTGYVTVTPDYRFEVSRRIKEDFENGRDYYALNDTAIRLPAKPTDKPSLEALRWHNENRYLG